MHVFVVGGTGMLAGVTRRLARASNTVSVVSRRADRIAALGVTVNGLALDYHVPGALRSAVTRAQVAYGPIELVVSWIHSTAPHAHEEICKTLAHPARYVRVLGSSAASPDADRSPLTYPHVATQDVVLGFVVEGERSRWLTHDEICAGVTGAIGSPRARTIVGTVEPWSRRP